ncbi:MAG: hypothetical protein IOC92_05325 [Rhodobacter sp.]|nr:hypothetical protein [Rhodobacter sp.]MCA3461542.1 hypothetical protein [Rhodobacter sp.]MCA3464468.1 hypothetical protein [Rhodobacter sp.]MCA3466277.1 hypothetical protein [Rhodobacter sp.]MCA3472370.1 hypothetical protein [Rhodobacter sp.]
MKPDASPALVASAVEEMCRLWMDDLAPQEARLRGPSAPPALVHLARAIDGCFATVSALREEGPEALIVAEACQELQRLALAMLRRA